MLSFIFFALCVSILLHLLRSHINRQLLLTARYLFRAINNKKVQNLFCFFTMSRPNCQEPKPRATDPPPFDPTQPSTPISYPIKTLEELEFRSYFDSFHYPFNKSAVAPQSGPLPNRRRLLVCHDMAGGYGDDKWVQGGTNPDAYAIWHWHLIDVFVYFSHSLVTIPPPCWANAAHRHGVKVLGTFITEWDEGKAICNKLLSTKDSAQMYAERLTELAVALGFDGWLINMEVKLDVGQIPNLKEFVSHLTESMHSAVPESLVIWYDSVIVDGKLSWQDQLNENNKPFFDICDGIFVNYTWKESYPKSSAFVAGDRKFDVYMGIDVFGRNTFSGGQWNTNVALDLLRKEDVSTAIFAPGWVYESDQPPDFQTAQNDWWALVKKSWGILRSYPQVLPFYSNFDQGRGYHVSINGGQISDAPWCNISCQGFQPLLDFADDSSPGSIQPQVDLKQESYSGGGSIIFRGSLEDKSFFKTRLFKGDLLLGNLPLHFMYSVKLKEKSLLGLSLEFSSTNGDKKTVLLASRETNHIASEFIKTHHDENPEIPGWLIQRGSISMNGYKLTDIHAVCYMSMPGIGEKRTGSRSDKENVSEYFATLGSISLKSSEDDSVFPPHTSWLVEGQHIKWTSGSDGTKNLSIKIIWKLKDGNEPGFPNYYIYVEKLMKQVDEREENRVKEYLGVAHTEAFYVSNLEVSCEISSLKFRIQVCSLDGSNQKLDESPFLQLDAEGDQYAIHVY